MDVAKVDVGKAGPAPFKEGSFTGGAKAVEVGGGGGEFEVGLGVAGVG